MASSSRQLVATAHDTADEFSRRDELAERLRWLINLRWVALAGVCGVVFGARQLELVVSIWPLVSVMAAMAVLNLGFHGLHLRMPVRTLRALSAEALLQSAVDVVGLGLLIFFSGGLSNPFVFYFTFHVVIAAILLEKRQAYTVALLTTGVVLFLGIADALGIGSPWPLSGDPLSPQPAHLARFGLVFALGTTLVISVYMVTAIMDRLREHSRDIRRLNADLADRVEKLAGAEKRLAAEHYRVRAILECMDEGVVVVDLQGKVLLSNTAAQASALIALEDTLSKAGCREPHACENHAPGCDDHDHAHAPASAAQGKNGSAASAALCPMGNPSACLTEVLAKGGKLCPATLALLGADAPPRVEDHSCLTPPKVPVLVQIEIQGRRFENTLSGVRTGANEVLGLVVVSRDVTERRSLERQVVHAEKLHALGNLAAGVAHELNTPLGTILGYAQILLDDEQSGRTPKELKAIEDQARRCRRIVQGLLDFARKSSGGREACAPNDLAIKIRDLISHPLELRGIALRLELSELPLPKVLIAMNEIEQVLVNLITNAADAVELAEVEIPEPAVLVEGGPVASNGAGSGGSSTGSAAATAIRRFGSRRMSVSRNAPAGVVTIRTARESNGEILIAVEDNGPGVPGDLAEQVFEPFFTTKAAGKGTGLGLSIARRIVEDHNGHLVLAAREGGESGARFELRLKPM